MTGAIIILAVTVVAGLLLWLHDRRHTAHTEDAHTGIPAPDEEEGCCGRHAVCERTSLTPLGTEPVYYDDHELDRFRDRQANGYTAAETEEFRDVLTTMRADEVAGWARSLQTRGIVPPADIRDEILLIVSELRSLS